LKGKVPPSSPLKGKVPPSSPFKGEVRRGMGISVRVILIGIPKIHLEVDHG
jgi:hypothetical protein